MKFFTYLFVLVLALLLAAKPAVVKSAESTSAAPVTSNDTETSEATTAKPK